MLISRAGSTALCKDGVPLPIPGLVELVAARRDAILMRTREERMID